MIKVILKVIVGVGLFGATVYTAFLHDSHNIDFFTESILNNERETSAVQGASIEAYREVNYTPDETVLDPGVTSAIHLRYGDNIYPIDPAEIRLMLGGAQSVKEASENLDDFGRDGISEIVKKTFESEADNFLKYQENESGIQRDKIKGFYYYDNEYGPDIEEASEDILRILKLRLAVNFGQKQFVTLSQVYRPGTNGEYSNDKYIELDHSAQKVYAWENGELYKSWDASGFYDEYAVYGVFDIKNKSVQAWSPIAEKWMPYWMAFYYETKQAAWFGLHELVWWYDEDGNYIEESEDSIGKKKSGGCVRLNRGEMEELYEWSEVGIHFLIHK